MTHDDRFLNAKQLRALLKELGLPVPKGNQIYDAYVYARCDRVSKREPVLWWWTELMTYSEIRKAVQDVLIGF